MQPVPRVIVFLCALVQLVIGGLTFAFALFVTGLSPRFDATALCVLAAPGALAIASGITSFRLVGGDEVAPARLRNALTISAGTHVVATMALVSLEGSVLVVVGSAMVHLVALLLLREPT